MKYFGTDGIRGIANTELSPSLAYKTGRALAYKLREETSRIVIGTDTRISRSLLKSALTAGILSVGVDVIDLGIIPTPAVAYFANKSQALAGVVISASHNPGEYNGIKIFKGNGYKFSDDFEQDIEDLIDKGVDYNPTGPELGTLDFYPKAYEEYMDFLLSHVKVDLSGIKLGLDTGHGATLVMAEDLFTRAGAQVFAINTDFNGMDINAVCGSTNTQMLKDLILNEGLDLGFAFDGDGDRLIAVDEKGREMDGDHYLAALAYYMKASGSLKGNSVVGTVMANIGLKKYLESIGLDLVQTSVGDRYVMEEMLAFGYNLGGEQSGHFLHLDDHTTGCGLLSALKLLEAGVRLNMKISDLNDLMTSYPQVMINAKVKNENKNKYNEDPILKEAIDSLETKMKGNGRVLIRPSGTEPLIRVMLEGEREEELYEDCQKLASLIEDRLN